MPTPIRNLALLVGVLTATLARPAAAQSTEAVATVRGSRPVSIGFSPAWPWMSAHDYTAPLPAVRLGVNLSPRLALDLTAGTLQFQYNGWTLVDAGARWFFMDGNASPYLMGRAGMYYVDGDEGPDPDQRYAYATLGAGLEYAADGGFTAWAEGGPALIDGNGGGYASVGIGYRFGATARK